LQLLLAKWGVAVDIFMWGVGEWALTFL
jgi:hypothetical protein